MLEVWAQEQGETSPAAECPLAAAALSPGLGTHLAAAFSPRGVNAAQLPA